MDLLHAQFNHGPLSLEEVKAVLGSDFGQTWPSLVKKFSEKEGKFFNERMEQEKQNRKKHSKKQSENARKRWDKSDGICDGITNADTKTMPLEDESENKDEIVNVISFGKFENLLTDLEIGSTIEFIAITANKTIKAKEIEKYFQAFLIHSEGKFYSSRSEKTQHFRTWLKIQIETKPKQNGTHQQTFNSSKPGTADDQNDAVNKF